ncbi:hypothetical protein BY458DRAFT_516923, partial [Sporodiniella umbellata]
MRAQIVWSVCLGFVSCQSNLTLLNILNATQNSPVQWLSQWLQSSQAVNPMVSLLSQADRPLTVFVPSDTVYQHIQNNQTSDAYTSEYAADFNWTDLMAYHILNQSVSIQTLFSNASVYNATAFDTLVTNTTLDPLALGVPLLIQQKPNANQTVSAPGLDANHSVDLSQLNYTVGTALGDVQINTSQVLEAVNGYIYIIEKVLVPPVDLNQTVEIYINQTVASYPLTAFEALLVALNTTNASAYIEYTNTTNNTYFVPVDSALPPLNDSDLIDFLKAHTAQGVFYTANVTADPFLSYANTSIDLAQNGTGYSANAIPIVYPNILVDTGVVHVIDGVLNYTLTHPIAPPVVSSLTMSSASMVSSTSMVSSSLPTQSEASPSEASPSETSASASSPTDNAYPTGNPFSTGPQSKGDRLSIQLSMVLLGFVPILF